MPINTLVADYNNSQHGEAIIELLCVYAQDPMGGGQPLSDFVQKNLIEQLRQIPYAFTILAYDEQQPVGLINCFEGFSTFKCKPLINIHDVIVLSDFRGLGISQLMLSEVEKIALNKGCCKLTLEVLSGNNPAKKAYASFGFQAYELNPEKGQALFWEKFLDT